MNGNDMLNYNLGSLKEQKWINIIIRLSNRHLDYYKNGQLSNPQGPEIGILKVIKGGSWHSFKADIRSASRGKGGFALKTDGIGFRCAK